MYSSTILYSFLLQVVLIAVKYFSLQMLSPVNCMNIYVYLYIKQQHYLKQKMFAAMTLKPFENCHIWNIVIFCLSMYVLPGDISSQKLLNPL